MFILLLASGVDSGNHDIVSAFAGMLLAAVFRFGVLVLLEFVIVMYCRNIQH